MGFNKRHVTTHGIFESFKTSGVSGLEDYFSVDALLGINDNKFSGRVYEMMISHANGKTTKNEIELEVSFHQKKHESLLQDLSELSSLLQESSSEYIKQLEKAKGLSAYNHLVNINKEILYYE